MTFLRMITLGLILFGLGTAAVQPAASDKAAPLPHQGQPQEQSLEMTDIHDIKPPLPVALVRNWIFYTIAAVLFLCLAAAGWWLWQKKRKGRHIETAEAPLPPEVTARRMLGQLTDIRHMGGREFYFRLSLIIRRYIYERYAVGAPEMTSEEFLPRIDGLSLEQKLQIQLQELIRRSDPIKFAGVSAMERQMQDDLDFAYRFVDQTTRAITALENADNTSVNS
jgi:cbb3-type cytochrome oxidase subunit 3